MRRAALLLGTLAATVLTLALAARAEAFVYWANEAGGGSGSIGRANLDGSGVDNGFITGATGPFGVAVDDTHIHWANASGTSAEIGIGRANLDGTGADQTFITGANLPFGVAVDGTHIYWANAGGTTIGRANLDGTGVDQSFITGASPRGVAVDDTHVYWANATTIGRANLDGTGVDQSFITGLSDPGGVAVDGTHVYWANQEFGGTTIGRANLDGTGVDQSFITGASNPWGVAVDDTHIYWANLGGTTIGRANLDGTGVDQSFITGATNPSGVAVDALGPPACQNVAHSTGAGEPVEVSLDCFGQGTLTYELVTEPAGQISDFDDSSGTLVYTPEEGFTGEDSFTYRASNAGGPSKTATATIAPSTRPRRAASTSRSRSGRTTSRR